MAAFEYSDVAGKRNIFKKAAFGSSGARQSAIVLRIYVQMKRTAGSDANVLYRSVSLHTDWIFFLLSPILVLSEASRPDAGPAL